MKEEKRPEGLIPKAFKRWAFSKRFTKAEREELKQIEKDAYMKKAREVAKEKGISKADEDFNDEKEV